MATIYVDADACPVTREVYQVAARHGIAVKIVANQPQRVPVESWVELVHCPGFGEVDDWIVEHVQANDVVVTSDIPLAARCLARDARVLGSKGYALTDRDIGSTLAVRDLNEELRQSGLATRGPAPMTPRDRSRFLAKLDEILVAVRRAPPTQSTRPTQETPP